MIFQRSLLLLIMTSGRLLIHRVLSYSADSKFFFSIFLPLPGSPTLLLCDFATQYKYSSAHLYIYIYLYKYNIKNFIA